MSAADPFLRRLAHTLAEPPARMTRLDSLLDPPEAVRAGATLAVEAEPLKAPFVLTAGWAARERLLTDGGRQIISFMIPGDISCSAALMAETCDHTITALGPVTVRRVRAEAWRAVMREDPAFSDALWRVAAQDAAVLKEHVVALGRRTSAARVIYLVWELWRRLSVVDLAKTDSFEFPVSQEVLSDAVGMTPRHLGRVLARLNEAGIIRVKGGTVTILDHVRLKAEADCRDDLLHLGRGAAGRASPA